MPSVFPWGSASVCNNSQCPNFSTLLASPCICWNQVSWLWMSIQGRGSSTPDFCCLHCTLWNWTYQGTLSSVICTAQLVSTGFAAACFLKVSYIQSGLCLPFLLKPLLLSWVTTHFYYIAHIILYYTYNIPIIFFLQFVSLTSLSRLSGSTCLGTLPSSISSGSTLLPQPPLPAIGITREDTFCVFHIEIIDESSDVNLEHTVFPPCLLCSF